MADQASISAESRRLAETLWSEIAFYPPEQQDAVLERIAQALESSWQQGFEDCEIKHRLQ